MIAAMHTTIVEPAPWCAVCNRSAALVPADPECVCAGTGRWRSGRRCPCTGRCLACDPLSGNEPTPVLIATLRSFYGPLAPDLLVALPYLDDVGGFVARHAAHLHRLALGT